MSCTNCKQDRLSKSLHEAKKKAAQEAAKGSTVAIVQLANGSGYGWRYDGDESLARLQVEEWLRICG